MIKIDAPLPEGDAHLSGEIHAQLSQYCAGAGSSIVAGNRKDFLGTARRVQDDRVGNAVSRSDGSAIRARSGAAGRVSRGAASTADHDGASIEGRGGTGSIDHPKLAELIADE